MIGKEKQQTKGKYIAVKFNDLKIRATLRINLINDKSWQFI